MMVQRSECHRLKIDPCYFELVASGQKRAEVRSEHDRSFANNDLMLLEEYDREKQAYSGRWIKCRITHKTSFAQRDKFAVLSFVVLDWSDCMASRIDTPIKQTLIDACAKYGIKVANPEQAIINSDDLDALLRMFYQNTAELGQCIGMHAVEDDLGIVQQIESQMKGGNNES